MFTTKYYILFDDIGDVDDIGEVDLSHISYFNKIQLHFLTDNPLLFQW